MQHFMQINLARRGVAVFSCSPLTSGFTCSIYHLSLETRRRKVTLNVLFYRVDSCELDMYCLLNGIQQSCKYVLNLCLYNVRITG